MEATAIKSAVIVQQLEKRTWQRLAQETERVVGNRSRNEFVNGSQCEPGMNLPLGFF